MDPVKNGSVQSSKLNSVVSYVNNTNIDEISKKKEDELLYGADDDEGTLSDDSLRLRLSDDEDAEQEEQVSKDMIVEKKLPCNPQQVVEEAVGVDSKKLTQDSKSENSALPSDKCTSESKSTKDDTHSSENCNISTIVNKLDEKGISNIVDKEKSEHIYHEKEIVQVTNEIKDEMQLTDVDQNKNNDVEILNNDIEKGNSEVKHTFNSTEDLEVTEVSNMDTMTEHHLQKNENLSTNNHVKSNSQNAEMKIHDKHKLKETINEFHEINSTDTCKIRNSDIVNDSSALLDSTNSKIDKSEKLFTNLTISKGRNDKSIFDNIIDEVITNAIQYPKRPLVEIINSQNSMDLIRSINMEDMSSSFKDTNEYKNKKKNVEYEDITQRSNTPKTQVQNQNDSSIMKNRTEAISEEHDSNKSSNKILGDNSTSINSAELIPIDVEYINNENRTKNTGTFVLKRKRAKKRLDNAQNCVIEEDYQDGKESVRQKRKTAKNAEDIIRRKYLNNDSNSSDEEPSITLNHKLNQDVGLSTITTLKRNIAEHESQLNGIVKKAKVTIMSEETTTTNDIMKLAFVEKICHRNIKDKLPKFTQEQLEELLIQKIVETITMHSEIGQLREQARISEKMQEAMRTKLQQLTKQVKDFETVLTRNATDRRQNPDKFVPPIKINRSVGLQVNFITEQGMQTLQQIQQKSANVQNNCNSAISEPNNNNMISSPRREIKNRSSRQSEASMTTNTSTISPSSMQTPTTSHITTVTPAALVVAKPLESHILTLPNQPSTAQQLSITSQQPIQPSHVAIVLNGKVQTQGNRSTHSVPTLRNNDLIDLTDEEEKNKSTKVNATQSSLLEQQLAVTTKSSQCFPRMIQSVPINNNLSLPRLTYVTQSGGGTRNLLTGPSQIRPVTSGRVSVPFPIVSYNAGTKETSRAVPMPESNIQINKHPAPLPDTPTYAITPGWKLPPPAPSLKMSKVPNGIVLSWNMQLSNKYAEIASYQLYAYQEVAGVNPSISLWKKVGDVKSLALPMACTLTQFSEGNNYYFAVRAVDTHSRKGQFSIPGNISL